MDPFKGTLNFGLDPEQALCRGFRVCDHGAAGPTALCIGFQL